MNLADEMKSYVNMGDLTKIAKIMNYSPKYLSRVFKESTGQDFTVYRLNLQILKAKKMLLDTHFNISDISFHLGYKNPESFSRIFLKKVGVKPSAFRRNSSNLNRKEA